MNFKKIKQWIYKKYEEENQLETNELVWLKKKVKAGQKIDWTFVDTVDYNIDSIPKRRELILEFKAKPKEALRTCKNILNYRKELS